VSLALASIEWKKFGGPNLRGQNLHARAVNHPSKKAIVGFLVMRE